jgi:ferredoxin-NADP reductase
MARATALGRLSWLPATLVDSRWENKRTRTLVLDVDGWPGHVAGQHVDVRLTAPDGYTATRSYSVGSAAGADRLELTVAKVEDGEVSPYLTDVFAPGARVEVRGPLGRWFVWSPEDGGPVQLLAGGVGLVPLMSMLRTRRASGSDATMRLLYSVRDPESELYVDELGALAEDDGVDVRIVHTRRDRSGAPGRRLTADDVAAAGVPAGGRPTSYVCGPTGFVEAAARLVEDLGHEPGRIRTERFGPTGGRT